MDIPVRGVPRSSCWALNSTQSSGELNMRPLILILLLACAARPPGQPNFTGTWKQLEEPRSSQDRRFNTQNRLAQQEQKLSVTTILGANGDRQESTYTREYEIGGEPKVTTDREGDQFTNIVRWEGDSLMFETVKKEKSATLTSPEVWTRPPPSDFGAILDTAQ